MVDDILYDSRTTAEEILDQMREIIRTCCYVTVNDLYMLSDVPSKYEDSKYGWTDLSNAYVKRERFGWIIYLPLVTEVNKRALH